MDAITLDAHYLGRPLILCNYEKNPPFLRRQEETLWLYLIMPDNNYHLAKTSSTPACHCHVHSPYTTPKSGTRSCSFSEASDNWFTDFLSLQLLSSSWWLQHLYRCPFQYLSSRNKCSALTEIDLSLCITPMQGFQNMPANSVTPLQSRGGVYVFSLWVEVAWVTTY